MSDTLAYDFVPSKLMKFPFVFSVGVDKLTCKMVTMVNIRPTEPTITIMNVSNVCKQTANILQLNILSCCKRGTQCAYSSF